MVSVQFVMLLLYFKIQFVKNVPLDVLSEFTEHVIMDFQIFLEGFVSIC